MNNLYMRVLVCAFACVVFLSGAAVAQPGSSMEFMENMVSDEYKEKVMTLGIKDCQELGLKESDEISGWCSLLMSGVRVMLLKTDVAKAQYDKFTEQLMKQAANINQQNPDIEQAKQMMIDQQKFDEKMFLDSENQRKLDSLISTKIAEAKAECSGDLETQGMCAFQALANEMETIQRQYEQDVLKQYQTYMTNAQ